MIRITGKAGCRMRRQHGMTLLEVLVSMLVIGLALAMSISMIQTANRYGETAEYTAAALQRAQSIIDKMRANNVAAPAYVFDGGAKGTNYNALYGKLDMGKIPNDLKCQIEGVASTAPALVNCNNYLEQAKQDMVSWSNELQQNLPGGKGMIRRNGSGYEIIVMWNYVPESEAAQASAASSDLANGITVRFSL